MVRLKFADADQFHDCSRVTGCSTPPFFYGFLMIFYKFQISNSKPQIRNKFLRFVEQVNWTVSDSLIQPDFRSEQALCRKSKPVWVIGA